MLFTPVWSCLPFSSLLLTHCYPLQFISTANCWYMPHHVCHVTSVLVSVLGPCAHAGRIMKIQETAYQNISVQKHPRLLFFKCVNPVVTFQTCLHFYVYVVRVSILSSNWSVLHQKLITSQSKMGMHVLIKLWFCGWIQIDLVWNGWEKGRAVYHSDNKGPACPLSTPIISCHIHFWTQMPH